MFNRTLLVGLVALAATMALASPAQAGEKKPTRRPNVIILLTDDQGYADLSCHGNPVLKTPNLDRLFGRSVRFTQFHVAPMCTPTRGQLMTGLDALRNGATSVTAGRAVVRRGIPTLADFLQAAGYATGIFGKWHLGDNYPYRPMDRGFQEAVYFKGWGFLSAPEFNNDYFNGRYLHNGQPKQFKGYCTDFWFDQAMRWMKERKEKGEPFFCYLPTNTPHAPMWVESKYAEPYKKFKPQVASFFGMIANLDENVGRLEAFLRDTGLDENTILIFMTDNGGTAGVPVFNAGMRGRKTTLYEGGHRVPCFVRWPAGKLRPPGDIDVPAQAQDILPTVLDLCGVERPRKTALDGVSLAGLLRGTQKTLADRMLVVQYGQNPATWDSCVIWGRWRLVYGKELFDLQADPGQKTDVAAQHKDVVARMRVYYEKWWAGVEPLLKEYSPIALGSEKENPVRLSSSDWQKVYCDNNKHVSDAVGGPRGEAWHVYVERDGEYEIALRRWPDHVDAALSAGLPERKVTAGTLPVGKSMPAVTARLIVAGQEMSARVGPKDRAVVFTVRLRGGTRTTLQGWFQDADGRDLCGAFYAVVTRR